MSVFAALSFHRGDDVEITFTRTSAKNIAGWGLALEIAADWDALHAGDVLHSETDADITDAVNGVFKMTITAEVTEDWAQGTYFYRVRRTDEGFEGVLVYGPLKLLP